MLNEIRSRVANWIYPPPVASKALSPRQTGDRLDEAAVISGFSRKSEQHDIWATWTHEAWERLGITSPLVKPNVDLLAKAIAKNNIIVQQKDPDAAESWLAVDDHPLEQIFNSIPFPGIGASYSWWSQMTWLLLHGEAYWMNIPNGFGELKYALPIPAYMIKPIPWKRDDGGPVRLISYFAYTPKDPRYPERLETHQVLFHKIPNPFSPVRGLSLLSAYIAMLKVVTEADRFDLDDYTNGLTLSKLISMRPDTTPTEFRRAVQDFEIARYEGKRHNFVRAGDVSVSELATRRGEDGVEVHKRAKALADRVWGIPEGVRDPNATEANATIAFTVFQRETIQPLLTLRDQDIHAQVIPYYYPESGDSLRVVSTDPVIPNREEERAEDEFAQRVWTVDEVRKTQGMQPHPDQDIGNGPTGASAAIAVEKVKASLFPQTQSNPESGRDEVGQDESGEEFSKHVPILVYITCPLCGHEDVDQYSDHGGLCVCRNCKRTFDPDVEVKTSTGNGNGSHENLKNVN